MFRTHIRTPRRTRRYGRIADFDLREIGLLYYVMASSQTLGEALKRLARYSKVTNEALVFGYREGNRLIVNLSYSGISRH